MTKDIEPILRVLSNYLQQLVADAIIDRLTAGAHRIELKGESLRRKK